MSAGAGATTELEPDMANVGTARRFVRDRLTGQVPDGVLDDLALVTSELVTNAFEHGSTGPVGLSVAVDEAGATVTVTSRGNASGVPAVDQWVAAAADRVSGRGLGIVRQLVDDIDVQRSRDDVAITVRRRFAIAGS